MKLELQLKYPEGWVTMETVPVDEVLLARFGLDFYRAVFITARGAFKKKFYQYKTRTLIDGKVWR